MKQKIVFVAIAFVLSIGLAYLFPSNIGESQTINGVKIQQEESIIKQDIHAVSLTSHEITKIYQKEELIGVVMDANKITDIMQKAFKDFYESEFLGYQLEFDDDVYTVKEHSFWQYENKDNEICQYLYDNQLFSVKANKIDILKDDKIIDTIYVKDQNDFVNALKRFAKVFTDEETFIKLENGEVISSLDTYGEKDVKVYLENVIKSTMASASSEDIYTNEDEIYDYLCYGKNPNLEYYTVKEFDTIYTIVADYYLSVQQIMAINPQMESSSQALIPGDKINITYFTSPIDIVVERQRYVQETVFPGATIYELDNTLPNNSVVLITEEENGYNDALYTDIYINGILTSYRKDSEKVVKEPVTGVYHIGKAGGRDTGTLKFILPCDNPIITTTFYGYVGHHGVDIINRYVRYCDIYAIESGVVTSAGYASDMGYYIYVKCNDDYTYRLLHFYEPAYVNVGDEIVRGQIVATMGSTGRSSGPHVDVGIIYKGDFIDPCQVLPCAAAGYW